MSMYLKKTPFLLVGILVLVLGLGLWMVIKNKTQSLGIKHILRGKTMGTTYSVSIVDFDSLISSDDLSGLQEQIDNLLVQINSMMSIYEPDSEIMKVNNYRGKDWFLISKPLYELIGQALDISEKTGGYYDITVGDLVKLWSFGPGTPRFENPKSIPSKDQIKKVLDHTGYKKIALKEKEGKFYIKKLHPKVFLDLSSIAKGYGIDQVAQFLASIGFSDYLVEIGGDIVTNGLNSDKKPYRVGVQQPTNVDYLPMRVIRLSQRAIATSGSYKNFYNIGKIRYSHLINPISGESQTSPVLSTSVIAGDCQTADAWATALYMLSFKEGLELATRLKLGVYYIYQDDQGGLAEVWNDEFSRYLEKTH